MQNRDQSTRIFHAAYRLSREIEVPCFLLARDNVIPIAAQGYGFRSTLRRPVMTNDNSDALRSNGGGAFTLWRAHYNCVPTSPLKIQPRDYGQALDLPLPVGVQDALCP